MIILKIKKILTLYLSVSKLVVSTMGWSILTGWWVVAPQTYIPLILSEMFAVVNQHQYPRFV